MHQLKRRFTIELNHFFALTPNARLLLLSYAFYILAYPLIGIFLNAYFWRQRDNLSLILHYNLFWFIGLPLGFYLNGLLLKHVHVRTLYGVGAILQGLGAILVVFSPNLNNINTPLFGFLYGIGGGLYWANKNYLHLEITRGQNRVYFNNLEYALDLGINILMPFITGWFIVFGEQTHTYTTDFAYKFLMIVAIILLAVCGYLIKRSSITDLGTIHVGIRHASRDWNTVRLYNILYNLMVGVSYFLPGVLILKLVGMEGILGTVETGVAIISTLALYIIGRKASTGNTIPLVGFVTVLYLFGAVFLALNFTWFGVLCFIATSSIASSIRWTMGYSVVMEVMDREENTHRDLGHYAYICDNELFFNIGRVLGISIFASLMLVSSDIALRFTPLIIALTQFGSLIPLSYLVTTIQTKA